MLAPAAAGRTVAGMGITARPARPDDAPAMAAFHHRCWIEGYAGLVPNEVLDGLREEDRLASWQRNLASDDAPTTVLVDADDVPVALVR
ncbi:hypothetical protein B7486_64540, partial [cyanobacterium TDX16]